MLKKTRRKGGKLEVSVNREQCEDAAIPRGRERIGINEKQRRNRTGTSACETRESSSGLNPRI